MKAKTDYSKVGPGIDGAAAPGRKTGPRRWLWPVAGLAVLAVLIIVVAVACGGSDSGDSGSKTEAIKTAHGPSALVDGVPRGYTHDKAGALTAAVNFIQAISQAGVGRLDAAALREHAVGENPSPSLQSALGASSDRVEHDDTTFNSVPLVATVTNFTPEAATVSVWGESISQMRTGGPDSPLGVSTLYSTTTVTLAWEGGDWKATDWAFEPGPKPEDARFPEDGPLSQPGGQGLYVFYRD
ncbi:hypothetical protein FO059_18180 (plasmid) [Tomitella fengzijianii]|uniref:DUF8175 domain-containing protein n=1 Tax=Tomitella fengzijianii TaxID=2597660 RepID=A0A516X927_9ACTN|nr:hypothetical protein [Tomitella fengzijianii]QDQ99523.1 hypothetical protein FO059_18180 [Tomitella fengzijianii]